MQNTLELVHHFLVNVLCQIQWMDQLLLSYITYFDILLITRA